jgi:4-amino-4-deoxy-L-arabinose transferase-like glycosyltransferase
MIDGNRSRWLVALAVGLIVVLGAGVRLFDVNRRTLTHPEAYNPGIKLPAELVEFPLPRLTLAKVVSGCIRAEPHPPFYYMMMLAWTKVFGTAIVELRLPSVLCGIAGVFLVYLLGRREGGEAAGMVAAAMFAHNGHLILWSQSARVYALGCFLGLVSSVLLLRITRGGSRPLGSLILYCAATVAGTATVFFYWLIFITQILWVAAKSLRRSAEPRLLCWQLWTFLLATPVVALVAHQSRLPSHARREVFPFLAEFLQFGYLVSAEARIPLVPLASVAAVVLPFVALVLLAAGLASGDEGVPDASPVLPAPPVWLWALALVVGMAGILVLGGCSFFWGGKRTAAILAIAPLAAAVPFADRLLCRWWPRLQEKLAGTTMWLRGGLFTLTGWLAIVPILIILLISPVVPLFASRGVSLFTPYLLVTTARGLVDLVRRDLRWLVLAAVLAVAHPLSVYHFYHQPNTPRDYKALSLQMASRVQASDLILLRGSHWQTTPIFYYLDADRYHFAGKDYSQAIAKHPGARVWAVNWEDNYLPPELIDALRDYTPSETIKVWGAQAVLYTGGLKRSAVAGVSQAASGSDGSGGRIRAVLNTE